MSQSKFKDPEIKWEKQMCPFCGKPTGTQTECEQDGKRRLVSPKQDIILPIFSKDCAFKKINSWIGVVNYKLTPAILQKISEIDGVENLDCNSQYNFTVTIAKLHEDESVKTSIALAYRSYIKEMLAMSIKKEVSRNQSNSIVGVVMPNGNKFETNNGNVIAELISKFDRVGQKLDRILRKD